MKSAGTFLRRDGELLVTWLNIPSALQPKLLRIVQEQQFERLGSTRTHQVDVRLVDATNRDLGEMAKQGDFRGDLYHRLNVFPLLLPPLRVRREDIPALVMHFVVSLTVATAVAPIGARR